MVPPYARTPGTPAIALRRCSLVTAPACTRRQALDISPDTEIRAISHCSTNLAVYRIVERYISSSSKLLDLGAGEGFFAKLIGDRVKQTLGVHPRSVVTACDVAPENFRYHEVECDRIPDDGVLPYKDGTFDVVCCLEVVEHVEDQFELCRQIMRVLRPGGLAVLTTPNTLNLNSRLRTLLIGFPVLFAPLPLSTPDAVHTSGHIHPISYYYLFYALRRAGATHVEVTFDRYKRSAIALLPLYWPAIALSSRAFQRKLARKQPLVSSENDAVLRAITSVGMLTSRSIVVTARRG
ncbi:MAG: methyltransferase domain-containing protein [Gemmatimonadaceae bacterium]